MSELNKALNSLAPKRDGAITPLTVTSTAKGQSGLKTARIAVGIGATLAVGIGAGWWLGQGGMVSTSATQLMVLEAETNTGAPQGAPRSHTHSPTTKMLSDSEPLQDDPLLAFIEPTPEQQVLMAAAEKMSEPLRTQDDLKNTQRLKADPLKAEPLEADPLETERSIATHPAGEPLAPAVPVVAAVPSDASAKAPALETSRAPANANLPREPEPSSANRAHAEQTPQDVSLAPEASHMTVEQVSLTPAQLAKTALEQAEKALDSNDLFTAMSAFEEALRYQPENEVTRQKLAALHFGKQNTRKAFELLQAGIDRAPEGETLRLALAKLLIKAEQPAVALTPLVYLPEIPSRDYLAMRAALAQQNTHNAIARESYQALTQMEPENARWWLGLAIQQERDKQWSQAIDAYQQALKKVGISNQSQQFVQERLALLTQYGEAS
ncbi:hypothetical protein HGP28_17200 [Vibrio sp. SM6]|uniref:MSHA biogenesis protein MshN n=1 Tax=Vibrio agarilyticus TaxID=2726741 RepID=A0A7X8TTN5_9VIBR|nr:hypothetical protein [Vibrio agarilyticus]NLS14598.1 hypothetical protein [Vibrio agarilyticus]